MSIWLVLWICISLILIGFLGWSLSILLQQKKAWKAFAASNKLRYDAGKLMESPEMEGEFGDYKISFFTGEHVNPDLRGSRKMTAVEINLQSVLPIDAAVASGGMVPLVKDLGFKTETRPEHESWNQAYIAAGDNRFVLKAYLTDARVQALTRLMKIKNTWAILICRGGRMLLRIDTPNPLSSQEGLDKVVKLMSQAAAALEVPADEFKALKAEEVRGVVKESSLSLDDADVDAGDLRLEEDDESLQTSEEPDSKADE